MEGSQANDPDTTEVLWFQLIRIEDKENQNYLCFKCGRFMNSPHETKCCSKSFCQHCIEQILNQASYQGPRCSNSECTGHRFEYYQNAFAKREIDKLAITCKYLNLCNWRGRVGEHETHLLRECKHHKLQCKASGCDFTSPRDEMKIHDQEYQKPHQKFGKYEDQIAGLKREIAGLKRENTGLKKGISGLKRENTSLKRENAGHKREISGLNRENTGLKRENARLKRENGGLKREIKTTNKTLEWILVFCLGLMLSMALAFATTTCSPQPCDPNTTKDGSESYLEPGGPETSEEIYTLPPLNDARSPIIKIKGGNQVVGLQWQLVKNRQLNAYMLPLRRESSGLVSPVNITTTVHIMEGYQEQTLTIDKNLKPESFEEEDWEPIEISRSPNDSTSLSDNTTSSYDKYQFENFKLMVKMEIGPDILPPFNHSIHNFSSLINARLSPEGQDKPPEGNWPASIFFYGHERQRFMLELDFDYNPSTDGSTGSRLMLTLYRVLGQFDEGLGGKCEGFIKVRFKTDEVKMAIREDEGEGEGGGGVMGATTATSRKKMAKFFVGLDEIEGYVAEDTFSFCVAHTQCL